MDLRIKRMVGFIQRGVPMVRVWIAGLHDVLVAYRVVPLVNVAKLNKPTRTRSELGTKNLTKV